MVCGGSMDVFIERIAGEHGYTSPVAATSASNSRRWQSQLGYDVTVVDDREEYADRDAFPDETDVIHGE